MNTICSRCNCCDGTRMSCVLIAIDILTTIHRLRYVFVKRKETRECYISNTRRSTHCLLFGHNRPAMLWGQACHNDRYFCNVTSVLIRKVEIHYLSSSILFLFHLGGNKKKVEVKGQKVDRAINQRRKTNTKSIANRAAVQVDYITGGQQKF